MGDDLAPEQKLEIADRFVSFSPPGQISKVIEDVRTLVGDAVLTPPELAKLVGKANKAKFVAVTVPDNAYAKQNNPALFDPPRAVLLTPEGERDDGTFLDPTSQCYLVVNHTEQVCVNAYSLTDEDKETLDAVEPTRKEIDEAMLNYAKAWLPDAAVTTYAKKLGTQIQIVCCVGRTNLNLENYWAGMWRSQWSLTIEEGQDVAAMVGRIACNVHYFEDGNVQLDDGMKIEDELKLGEGGQTVGTLFAKKVEQIETDFMGALEDIYEKMSDTVLTALRRKLPVTRVKFDWAGKAKVHKLAKELNQMGKQAGA